MEKENHRQLITKGALEEMLSICTFVELGDDVIPITNELIAKITAIVHKLNEDGMRVLAVAEKANVPDETTFSVKDESQMTLIGYMGFLDPAKESADIILLEKDLNVLEEGVVEGRQVFGNINKYIKITASSNFGNIFSVLVASTSFG